MPQSCYNITMTDEDTTEDFINKGNNIAGVKWINVNIDKGLVVVTHDDDYDEAAFKSVMAI